MITEDIIQGCIKGDRDAQRVLHEELYSPLYRMALRYEKDEVKAKELLQDVFIKIFNKIDTYKNDAKITTWASRFVINTYIDKYRRESNNPELLYDFNICGSDYDDNTGDKRNQTFVIGIGKFLYEEPEDFEIIDVDKINIQDIYDAIQNLSDSYRTIFNLFVLDGYKHSEIAEKLNIGVGTSKANLSRAKKKLYKALKDKADLELAYEY